MKADKAHVIRREIEASLQSKHVQLLEKMPTSTVYIDTMNERMRHPEFNKLPKFHQSELHTVRQTLFGTINGGWSKLLQWRLSWRGKLWNTQKGASLPPGFNYSEIDQERSTHVWAANPLHGWGREVSPEEIPEEDFPADLGDVLDILNVECEDIKDVLKWAQRLADELTTLRGKG